MSQNARFTAWLTPAERQSLRRLAGEWGSSENFVMRCALRHLAGLSLPRQIERELGLELSPADHELVLGAERVATG